MKMARVPFGSRAKTLVEYLLLQHSKIIIFSSSSSGERKNRPPGGIKNVIVASCIMLLANTASMQAPGCDRRSFKFRKEIVANTGEWRVALSKFRQRH